MKTFKSVKWMRDKRTQIDEEDQKLSWAEKRQKTHNAIAADPIFQIFAKIAQAPKSVETQGVKESPTDYNLEEKD